MARQHNRLVAGVDEAGRGPLAGPVYAAAVILDPGKPIAGLRDSKKLSEKRRSVLFELVLADALACCIAQASVEEIDRLNILGASLLAMRRAVEGLAQRPDEVLVDGNRTPDWDYQCRAVVGGDGIEVAISAASILAKVARDRHMQEMDQIYPGYGFAVHKGYPTAQHLDCLQNLGPCKIHRQSYRPVRQAGLFGEVERHG